MQLTRAADYAVRVVVHLATMPPGQRVSRLELAQAADVPEHFLSKILQHLTHAGIIRSFRGVGGGFLLARTAADTTLLQVIEAVEGRLAINLCLMADRHCHRVDFCPVHAVWCEAQQAMANVLLHATMAELGAQAVAMRQTSWS